MNDDEKKERKEIRFQSWGEFLEQAVNRKVAPIFYERNSGVLSREVGGDDDDTHRGALRSTKTFEDCVKLAQDGWPEGVKKFETLSETLLNKATSLIQRESIQFDVIGSDFDMGLYLSGAPEHWYQFHSKIEDGEGSRICRLVLNCSVGGSISHEAIIARGATMAALVQSLEYAGIRTEVVLTESTGDGPGARHGYDIFIPLKQADQPLDIDRLVFALAHPDTERRLCFAVQEGWPDFWEHIYGYGCAIDTLPADQGDIYIGQASNFEVQWNDEIATVDWVIKQLKAQGVHIEGDGQVQEPAGELGLNDLDPEAVEQLSEEEQSARIDEITEEDDY